MVIYLTSGQVRLETYAGFIEAISDSDSVMALVFANGVLLVSGAHLRTLLRDLQQRQVKELVPFDPAHHLPAKRGEAVIESLGWFTREMLLNADGTIRREAVRAAEGGAPPPAA